MKEREPTIITVQKFQSIQGLGKIILAENLGNRFSPIYDIEEHRTAVSFSEGKIELYPAFPDNRMILKHSELRMSVSDAADFVAFEMLKKAALYMKHNYSYFRKPDSDLHDIELNIGNTHIHIVIPDPEYYGVFPHKGETPEHVTPCCGLIFNVQATKVIKCEIGNE